MQSQNHLDDKRYFAIRFDKKDTYTIAVYAIDREKIHTISQELGALEHLDFSNDQVGTMLREAGAVKTDMNNEETGHVYPAETKYDAQTHHVKRVTFNNGNGKANNPQANFPAKIGSRSWWLETQFCENGKKQTSVLRDAIQGKDFDRRYLPRIFKPEEELGDYKKFLETYKDLFDYFDNPEDFIDTPPLQNNHQVMILN